MLLFMLIATTFCFALLVGEMGAAQAHAEASPVVTDMVCEASARAAASAPPAMGGIDAGASAIAEASPGTGFIAAGGGSRVAPADGLLGFGRPSAGRPQCTSPASTLSFRPFEPSA